MNSAARVARLTPKIVTQDQLKDEEAKLDELRIGQFVEVKPREGKTFMGKVTGFNSETLELTVQIKHPARPAIVLPSQVDGRYDKVSKGVSSRLSLLHAEKSAH
jgi:hypothetical protein